MRLRLVLVVGLLLAMLRPDPALAQTWITDSNTVRLAWGTANVLVRADTLTGVQIWAETSRRLQNTPHRSFVARFDPDSAALWLNAAHVLVETKGVPHDTAATRLQTPALRAPDGSQLVLVRQRKGKKWEANSPLVFIGPEGLSPWFIEAPKEDAERFLTLLMQQAGASRWGQQQDPASFEPNPIDPSVCPVPLPGNPSVEFPQGHNAGAGGEVWLAFGIRTDGTPDPTSYRVYLNDHDDYTRAAINAIDKGRYRPAQRDGFLVEARVFQRVLFTTR